ncbi:endonuclease/exonuclease/phosphatase family protein [Porifericola rhodea]|uniref:endonuclease/exonuclease/phosphatase family protein n=1 Tax=Porifericola rhodea TaxID=930972 RepID=UPI0026661891|nr:endonuclease/exonuclease/phosphatase family protein [Porifericola rhodea]WKN31980.1 endonuclease/exonuclease/phosphatase family protein [Porifericola rhodea]
MKILGLLLLCLFASLTGWSQQEGRGEEETKIVFWNVENLFDTKDDTLTRDEEFLPYGIRGWSNERYQQKLFAIYKTLVATGGWELPDLIALAEVENNEVLKDLIERTPLLRGGYQIIHQESEDRRGIDLAILYRASQIEVSDTSFIRLSFPQDPNRKSRDIIHIKANANHSQNFHLFTNHWPSRYGGGKASEGRRIHAAKVLRMYADSILVAEPEAAIIFTGDFNDTPADPSLQHLTNGPNGFEVISLKSFEGTHKHQGLWSHFDHVWVNKNLRPVNGPNMLYAEADIFHPDWLLEEDRTYGGYKPKRTYVGYRYHGGFSDHLPLIIKLKTTASVLAGKEN